MNEQYKAGFAVGLNMTKESKELALQYLDSPIDEWSRRSSMWWKRAGLSSPAIM